MFRKLDGWSGCGCGRMGERCGDVLCRRCVALLSEQYV